jgi:hypothetical protein
MLLFLKEKSCLPAHRSMESNERYERDISFSTLTTISFDAEILASMNAHLQEFSKENGELFPQSR